MKKRRKKLVITCLPDGSMYCVTDLDGLKIIGDALSKEQAS